MPTVQSVEGGHDDKGEQHINAAVVAHAVQLISREGEEGGEEGGLLVAAAAEEQIGDQGQCDEGQCRGDA